MSNSKVRRSGRRKPYTEVGVRRKSCSRCGKPASTQWQCCANESRWSPLCAQCDVRLNEIAVRFMRLLGAETLLRRYSTKLLSKEVVTNANNE